MRCPGFEVAYARREFPGDCIDPTPIEITEWARQEPETPEEAAEMLAVPDRDLE